MSKSASRYLKYSADKQVGLYSFHRNQGGTSRDFLSGKTGNKVSSKAQSKCLIYFEKLVQGCAKIDRHKLIKLKQADSLLSEIHNTGINAQNRVKLKKLHIKIKKLIDSY